MWSTYLIVFHFAEHMIRFAPSVSLISLDLTQSLLEPPIPLSDSLEPAALLTCIIKTVPII